MKNYDWCAYTYKHRRALEYVINRYIKDEELKARMLERSKTHDLDKVLLYQFLDQEESQQYHVLNQPHHLDNNLNKEYEDYLETVLDYECAPYTKPDKPLNAYDFTHKCEELGYIDASIADRLYGIMRELGIDYSYDSTKDEDVIKFVEGIGQVTEEMIMMELCEFMTTNPARELAYLRERLGDAGIIGASILE